MYRDLNYPYSPISTLDNLAKHLGVPLDELIYVANEKDRFYKPGRRLPKKDGGTRITHDAYPRLKNIHEQIKNKLLKRVSYPDYIQGGIAVPQQPRSYITHSKKHSNQKVLICEDIASFYPNTNARRVSYIWKIFFGFPPAVADLLTKLTTYNEELPQGWKTSGYLANLTFFNLEPELNAEFAKKGLVYSRYIDDITISSTRNLSKEEIKSCISNVCKMLSAAGYRLKRSKHEILSSKHSMQMMGLVVNTEQPSVPKFERKIIRAMVHQLTLRAAKERSSADYHDKWKSASAKVARIAAVNNKQAIKLRKILRSIKPS